MKKKLVAWTLAMAFVISAVSGCGDTGENVQKESEVSREEEQGNYQEESGEMQDTSDLALEDYTEPISYSFWITGGAACADLGNTYLAQYIKENFNIDISQNFTGGAEDYSTKLNMAVAAKELPDVVMGYTSNRNLFKQMGEEGLLLPLDDYIEEYLSDYIDNYVQDAVLETWRADDGNLYAIPSFTLPSTEKIQEGKVAVTVMRAIGIRQDIFEDLNLDAPTNADEFYDALVKIKEADLTVNGEKVYPLGLLMQYGGSVVLECFQSMFGATLASNNTYFDEEKQESIMAYDLPQYEEMLKYVARLYREGLIQADAFNLTEAEGLAMASQGRYAVFFQNPWSMDSTNMELKSVDEKAAFNPIAPVYADGVTNSFYNSEDPYGLLCVGINANVEDPDRLFKFLQWMTSDAGWTTLSYGPPGEHDGYFFWDLDENGNIVADGTMVGTEKENEAWGGDIWFANVLGGYVCMPLSIKMDPSYEFPGYEPPADNFSTKATLLYRDETNVSTIGAALGSISKGPVEEAKGTSVSKVFNEGIAKLIMEAKSDEEVEAMWAQILKNANQAGYQEIKKEQYELRYETYLKITE